MWRVAEGAVEMAGEQENPTLRALPQVDAKLDTVLERSLEMTARRGSVEDQLARAQGEMSARRAQARPFRREAAPHGAAPGFD
jgi:hypothetical protein